MTTDPFSADDRDYGPSQWMPISGLGQHQLNLAFALADHQALSIVRLAPGDAVGWRDIRLLLNEHEFPSGATRDLHSECLEYARLRGLITLHPAHWHLVRITRQQA